MTIVLIMLLKICLDVKILYKMFNARVIHAWLREEKSYQRSW